MDEIKSANDRVKDRSSEKSSNLPADQHLPFDPKNLSRKKPDAPPDSIEFTNPYPPEKNTNSNQWTVAVQLAASNPSKAEGEGSKLDSIKKLAAETKDKPVTVLVDKVVPSKDESLVPKVEHYKLADGNVIKLPDTKSKGFDKDVESLVNAASHDKPSNKLALIVQSHGTAGQGMHGDNGKTSIGRLADAIKSGLDKSGHDKLDLLDFDACLMSESTVMDKMRSVTRDVVASEEMESAVAKSDGQNLAASLKHVTDNPSISGNDLAEKMIADAKAGLNGEGTHTLSHLNMQNYDEFRKNLDSFGEQLKECNNNQENRNVIDKAIVETHKMVAGNSDPSSGYEWRDLKAFAQKIQEAAKSGQLKDADGKLLDSATKLLTNFNGDNKIVQSSFGQDNITMKNMDKLGGLSVFLPQHSFVNDDKESLIPSTVLGKINSEQMNDLSKIRRDDYNNILNKIVGDLKPQSAKSPDSFKQLKAAVNNVNAADNEQDFQQQKQTLEELAKKLSYSKLNDADIKHVLEAKTSKRKDVLQAEVDAMQEGGWKQFISSLTSK